MKHNDDIFWMRKALQLAKKGWGKTSPNPMVGAIVVKNGEKAGSGWHRKSGESHAEILALSAAGVNAQGGTLYVTLEPCCTYGRTSPCVDAIIRSGITRVVVATSDPNPKHSGRGIKKLKRQGIQVGYGIEEKKAQRLNEAFFCWICHHRPFVLLKLAMTLDGNIATEPGVSQWISCPKSRKQVQHLRCWSDAILVGAETVRQDNPSLLVSKPKNWEKQPLRVIASCSGNLGEAPHVLTDGKAPTKVVCLPSRKSWEEFFLELGERNITSLLVEGGGEIAGFLLRAELIDKIAFFVAPKILGGKNSRPAFAGVNPQTLAEAKNIHNITIKKSGIDYYITGYLNRCSPDA